VYSELCDVFNLIIVCIINRSQQPLVTIVNLLLLLILKIPRLLAWLIDYFYI